jgi:CelD/BcsL family acetyltransferase involved in cellulose biosynthesis
MQDATHVRVELAGHADAETWNDCVERSPHGNPLHRYEALAVLARYSDTTVRPLVGSVGDEPVGVFPVFVMERAGLSAAFSPPPHSWIQYLGPVVVPEADADRYRLEARHLGFVRACLDRLDSAVNPRYVHLHTDPAYADPRAFTAEGFDVRPRYTYDVDLDRDREDLLLSFGSDARGNVRDGEDIDYEVREGDADDAAWIIRQVARRYDEQGKSYGVEPGMVRELYERLPDGWLRPYVCSVDGEKVTGMVALDDGDTVYRWQGGMKKDDVDAPANDLLDWAIMTDAMERGRRRYDLVGAEHERINGYKSKFNPDLSTYYTLTRASRPLQLVTGMYDRLGDLK